MYRVQGCNEWIDALWAGDSMLQRNLMVRGVRIYYSTLSAKLRVARGRECERDKWRLLMNEY